MNVLHLITGASHSSFLFDIAQHTDRAETSLIMGSLAPAGQLQECSKKLGIGTCSLGCKSRSDYPRAIVKLARYLRKREIDVLHTHLVDASLVGLAAARLSRTPVRVMTRHHSDAALLAGSHKAVALDRLVGRLLADEIIAVSEAVKRALVRIDRVSESKITLVPYGFDWTRIRARTGAGEEVRREFRIGDAPLLCTVGRLDRLKGHDDLLKAFAEGDLGKEAWLAIVGMGPQEQTLKAAAERLGIHTRCIFTGYRSDAYDIIDAADLVVHPSLSEAQNQVIIEALALGRPVVATDVGAAADVVVPGETGWLVPAGDPRGLAAGLRDALSDPARARRYASAGRARVRGMYPIQRMISSYEGIYRRRLQARS